jgi:regulator of RNase E activity RraA
MSTEPALLAQFTELDTATVSDALDLCGLPAGQGGLRPMWGRPTVAGFAVTVELEPLSAQPDADHGGAHILTGAIAGTGPDDVIVVANGGRTDVSSWGGIVSVGAAVRSIRGVVADGACRDVSQARELGFPVFARARVPVTARGRLRQKSVGEPVVVGDVTVRPGDVVMADEDGSWSSRASAPPRSSAPPGAWPDARPRSRRRSGPASRCRRRCGTPAWPERSRRDGGRRRSAAGPRDQARPAAHRGDLRRPGPGRDRRRRPRPGPLSDGFRAAGPAFTVRYAPAGGAGGTVGDFLDDVPPGAVIVIDNDGRTDVTVWGGIMTELAAVRGVAGTVINGVCRDVAACLAQDYPLFSRGRFMRTGKDRVRLASVGEPVTIASIEIHPGALVCADADGVVAVPAAAAEQVIETAERIERIEAGIVAAARAGSTLHAARERFGYHTLQTRQP